MDKTHVHMCFHIESFKSTGGIKTRLFSSPFLIFTSWFLILVKAFRNDHLATCSTALRSATEKSEMGGYVIVPCSSNVTQRIGLNSGDVTRLVATEHIRNKYSLLKSRSVIIAVIHIANLLTLSILI